MSRPLEISGDDIAQWSQQHDAPSIFPELIRKLLLASSPVSSITMSSHAGTRLSGWDGAVRTLGETAFCPAGLSVWELTVEDKSSKLNRDFEKRTSNTAPFDPYNTTYVAVSARRIANKIRWAAEKRGEGAWKDVRVLDADDIATWLAGASAVARWLAERLHRPVGDMEDLEGFLDVWSRRTRPRLPAAIALVGRDRESSAESVRAWARSVRSNAAPLRVHGDTWEEAAVFTAAALHLDQSAEGQQVRARTIVVRSDEALRWALRSNDAQPLIALAAYEQSSASLLGPAILPIEGPFSGNAQVLRLSRVPHRRLAEALIGEGMLEQEAARVAKDSDGSLTSLQRLLGHWELPRWAKGADPTALSAMLLVGSFEPDNKEDQDVLRILGADPGEVELLCERLRLGPDAPTQKKEGHTYRPAWSWRAPEDVWRVLIGQIPADLLRRFEEALRLVLGERDPMLDYPLESRFSAAMSPKGRRPSGPLREGLAHSLVRLSLGDEALSALHGAKRGSRIAQHAISDILPPPWVHWASLAGLLPVLAESAPGAFLDALEASLRAGDAGAAHILKEESFTASPHTGLLWALEALGWDALLLPRVASCLAKLADYDARLEERSAKIVNRPKRSLRALLRLVKPQTAATADQRIQEMKRLLDETPGVGFDVLVELLREIGGGVLHSASEPRFLRLPIPREDRPESAQREARMVAETYMRMALDHAGNDGDRWAHFLNRAPVRRTDVATHVLDHLEGMQEQIQNGRTNVWHSIREILIRASGATTRPGNDGDDGGAAAPQNPTEPSTRWRSLYASFEPENIVTRYAWLFRRGARLPEPSAGQPSFEEQQQRLSKMRTEALEDLGRSPIRVALLGQLAEASGLTGDLGFGLGNSTYGRELDGYLLDRVPPENLTQELPGFMIARWNSEGKNWAIHKLQALLDQGRADDVVNTLLRSARRETWDVAKALGEAVNTQYWMRLEYAFVAESEDDWAIALDNFLRVHNLVAAVENAELAKRKIDVVRVAEVLQALLGSPEQTRLLFRRSSGAYALSKLIDRLDGSPEGDGVYASLLGALELVYALGSDDPKRSTRRLSAAIANAPGEFVELVESVYRPAGEPPPMPSDLDGDREGQESRAFAAFRILEAWTGFPGEGLSEDEREPVLMNWSLFALRALVASGRPDTGAIEVARVLARAPNASDGHWPCVAARQLLETKEFARLGEFMHTAKRNLRGAFFRAIEEGGKQEQELAAGFRVAARKLRPHWPRTSDMLDGLAESYESDGARQDARAREEMRELGAESADFTKQSHRPLPSTKRRIVSPGIVRIDRIELVNFTIFQRLVVSLTPPLGRGQWVILLGENGRGKSSVLRALAMTLAGPSIAHASLAQLSAPQIRIGHEAAECEVVVGEARFSTLIGNDGTGETVVSEPATGARPAIFAFGCSRGSALGGTDSTDLASAFSDVATLFSTSARLYPAPAWLKELKLRALQDARYDHIFRTVVATLCKLLPDVERLDVVDNEVWAIAPKLGGRVPLSALSDGYLSMLGWLADFMARWLHRAEHIEQELDGDFFARADGLVLIDEIDLHLHPSWQREIVNMLKGAFPSMSFVVTTHNPLTLLGAEPGEVVVLSEGEGGSEQPEAKQLDLPDGIRIDRVLTGAWFGLPYTVDKDTIELIEHHQKMLVNRVPEDAPDRVMLEEKLASRYGSYADTSLDRMALEVAADLMRERRPKTSEEREKVRARIRELVRARLAQRNEEGNDGKGED